MEGVLTVAGDANVASIFLSEGLPCGRVCSAERFATGGWVEETGE